ncbi:MAG TPA: protein-methionine-sulfoxide reductase heme-binding subunit MsrQ [Alphaproteobacteria bacterium]
MPWFDYSDRVSPLKCAVFAALFLPALWTGWLFWHGDFGPARPVNETIHGIGRWTIRLIFASLAITPLRSLLNWPRLILVRRMIGVAAFAYVCLHLTLYIVDQAFDLQKVATEIVLRIYLEIGFTALLILAALAVTSTDGMMRRLRRNWTRLHRLLYVAAGLAVIHNFMQAKADVDQPWVMAGLYLWLMGYRLLAWRFGQNYRFKLAAVGALSLAAGAATAVGESIYYWIKVGVNPTRVLSAYLTFATWRPGWIVLAIGLSVTIAGAVRALTSKPSQQRPRSAAAAVTPTN